VRELENVIQRFVILGNEEAIIEELTPLIQEESTPEKNRKTVPAKRVWPSLREVHQDALRKAECETILKALEMTNWNRKKAADILDISYKALLYKIKETGLDKRFIKNRAEYPACQGGDQSPRAGGTKNMI
jgi:two-component system response regulator AtoC